MRNRVVDQCTTWLNFIVSLSPELTGYSVHFHGNRRAWEFRFYTEQKLPYCVEFFEHEINRRTLDTLKKTCGKLFR